MKNMYLCGLPVKRVWSTVRKFLSNYTDELPDSDEIQDKLKEYAANQQSKEITLADAVTAEKKM